MLHFDAKFPVFALREYLKIEEEGEYLVLTSSRTKWVLDKLDTGIDSYASRRLNMMGDRLPYRLYPLKKCLPNIESVIKSGHRNFIDSNGKVIVWGKKKFYPLVCRRILAQYKDDSGKATIKVEGFSDLFELNSNTRDKYAIILEVRERLGILMNTSPTRVKDTRKKL